MRALLPCLLGLMMASPDLAFAQMKLPSKTAPGAIETRYFTAIDGLMDGNADVILRKAKRRFFASPTMIRRQSIRSAE